MVVTPVGRVGLRWARRLALAFAAIVVALTLAAVGFDLATAGDSRAATSLYAGPFVRVGGGLVAYRRTLRVPRAVVWGADDTIDPVASGRATAAALGVGLTLIPGAGHLSMLAKPRAVAETIDHAPEWRP